jgi:hypothetical protein
LGVPESLIIVGAVVALRWGSFAVIISIICFVISIYLALPTFRIFDWVFGKNLDEGLKLQLLVLATAFFVSGIVILVVWITSLAIKRALFKTEPC